MRMGPGEDGTGRMHAKAEAALFRGEGVNAGYDHRVIANPGPMSVSLLRNQTARASARRCAGGWNTDMVGAECTWMTMNVLERESRMHSMIHGVDGREGEGEGEGEKEKEKGMGEADEEEKEENDEKGSGGRGTRWASASCPPRRETGSIQNRRAGEEEEEEEEEREEGEWTRVLVPPMCTRKMRVCWSRASTRGNSAGVHESGAEWV